MTYRLRSLHSRHLARRQALQARQHASQGLVFIVGKGWIDADTWTQVGGAALTLITAVWSVFHNNAQAKAAGK